MTCWSWTSSRNEQQPFSQEEATPDWRLQRCGGFVQPRPVQPAGTAVVPLSLHAHHYSSLICSAQCAHRWILMPWKMIAMHECLCSLGTQMQTLLQKLKQTYSCLLRPSPSETLELPCSASSPRRRTDARARTERRTHTALPSVVLYQSSRRMEKRISFKWNQ